MFRAIDTAAAGIRTHVAMLERAPQQDVVESTVTQVVASTGVKAAVAALRTSDDTLRHLLDVRA